MPSLIASCVGQGVTEAILNMCYNKDEIKAQVVEEV